MCPWPSAESQQKDKQMTRVIPLPRACVLQLCSPEPTQISLVPPRNLPQPLTRGAHPPAPQREGSVTGFLLAPARAGPRCPAAPGISSENDSHSKQMASTAWVCLPELLAEQARLVFASRARAVPPPARSVLCQPGHLCRVGSPRPCPPSREHCATNPAPDPPQGTPQDHPPALTCSFANPKAASLLPFTHVPYGAPEIPGEESWRWHNTALEQCPRLPHVPGWDRDLPGERGMFRDPYVKSALYHTPARVHSLGQQEEEEVKPSCS